jgi:pimeloyl-ACP methyl ester carboxylesterase
MQQSETGYADVNGLKLYYEVHGTGKPIVLLHGSYMNIPMNWAHVVPRLSQTRQVIVAEMQGHGRTRDVPREFSYQGMADDVAGLLDHLKIAQADVLGYSMGAGVAFQVGVRHRQRVRRMVILSGAYKHDGWWPDVEATFATMTAQAFRNTPIEQEYLRFGNDPAGFGDFIEKVISIDLKPYDWSKDVLAIDAPMFVVLGDADGIRYEHALELFRAKGGGKMGDMHGMPPSRLAILPGTTHAGMMQRMDWLLPMLNDFLDSDLNGKPPTF